MQTSQRLFLALVTIAGALAAQAPSISGIVNAASSISPGLPNYAIAPGSVFLIYGSNLSSPPVTGAYTAASLPLPTTAGLTGTVVTITSGVTTVTAPILFTLPGQIGAVLPSTTPVGSDTLTLTYNGNSASSPITVLASAFGISNSAPGTGPSVAALVFGTNQNEFVTQTDSATAGDVVVLYGTGLGPIAAGNTDTNLPPAGNIGNAPVVFVGGVASPSVSYYGRSPCCVGLDEIAFTIPANAPTGCQVSIVVQTSNGITPIVSNGPTTAIAATRHTTCTDPVNAFPPYSLSQTNIKLLAVSLKENTQIRSGTTSAGVINNYEDPGPPNTTSTEVQSFGLQLTGSQFATIAASNVESSQGSCLLGVTPNPTIGAGSPTKAYLDIGPSAITLTPPSGPPIDLPATVSGLYLETIDGSIPSGTWGYGNSDGVTALNFNFPVPQPIVWTNQSALFFSTVTRANGLTITWLGSDPNGYVDIQGYTQSEFGAYLAGFDCSAPIASGHFTIPPSILLAMPVTGIGIAFTATLQVSTNALPLTLPAIPGYSMGINFTSLQTSIPINFK